VLLEHGSSLVDILVPGKALLTRARAALPGSAGSVAELEALIKREKSTLSGLEQSQIFEQCTNVLRELAKDNPLTLALDDLQWADQASLDLLFHLCRRLEGDRILIVGCYRPEEVALGRDAGRHPLESIVNEIQRIFGEIIIDLGAGEEAEGKTFIDSFLDSEPNRLGSDFRQALYEHTGGHALFTIELLRTMQERGDLVQDDAGRWVQGPSLNWNELPARVEAVIAERIGRLDADLRELLSVASVEGEDFTAQVVAQVQDIKERRTLRELSQELEKRHRLVHERDELRVNGKLLSRYRFAHQLIQRYLYNDLSAGERRLLHGEIAGVLEELSEEQADEIAVQLAFHYGRAENPEKELHYLLLSGKQALSAYAHKEAERSYRKALDLAYTTEDLAEVQSGLGEALFGQNRFNEAIQVWHEGIELYRSLGVEGLNGIARLYARSARAADSAEGPAEGLKLCKIGLEAIESAPESREVAMLTHEAGRVFLFNGFPQQAEPFCRQALEMADRLGAVDVKADALATYGLLPDLPPDEALVALEKAVEIAEAAGLLDIAARAQNNLGYTIENIGDIRNAREHYKRSLELDRKIGTLSIPPIRNVADSSLLLGDLTSVEQALPELENIISRITDLGGTEQYPSDIRAQLMISRGQWMDALRLLRKRQHYISGRGDLQKVFFDLINIAHIQLELYRMREHSDLCEAEAVLGTSIELSDRGMGDKVEPRCILCIVYAHQGKFDDAHQLLAEAHEFAESNPTIWNEVSFKSAEAGLSYFEERWEDSLAAFEAAASIYAQMEARPSWARILMLWADVHIARGEPGDMERAEDLLHQALEAYEDMDIPYWVSMVKEKLEDLGAEVGE
jgi:tetratricopeptide (TPR) repeat protein